MKSKLTISVAILVSSIILGGFFYAAQISKQESIERQQQAKMDQEREIQEAKLKQEKEVQEAKLEQAKEVQKTKVEQEEKEYVAKRKSECYTLYEKERIKWNNAKGVEYDEENDVCLVRYKATDEWKDVDCNDYLINDDTPDYLVKIRIKSYVNCKDNSFTKEF